MASGRRSGWLAPDHVVIYDRATTKTEGRFKRFWLQAPAQPTISGKQALVNTPKGQLLSLTSLLPADATLTALKHDKKLGAPAVADPMKYRIVEAPGGPKDVRFLNVVQGADGGTNPTAVAAIRSTSGAAYDGAVIGGTEVLFPVVMDGGGATTVPVPAAVTRTLVTGLKPGGAYTASRAGATLAVSEGGSLKADDGGVLKVT